MATLSEGLEWMLKANTKQLEQGIDKGKAKVKELDKETKKATDGMGKGFLQAKESIEKARGAILFYSAAVVALVAPAVKASLAMSKLTTAAKMAGQSTDGLDAAAKKGALALGTTIWDAANRAAEVMGKFRTSVDGAFNALKAGDASAKLGLAGASEAISGIGAIAQATKGDIGALATTLGPELMAVASRNQADLGALSQSIASVATEAGRAGVSAGDLVRGYDLLMQKGATLGEAQTSLSSLISAAVSPTDEQRQAFERLGLNGFDPLVNVKGPALFSTLQQITQQAQTQGGAVSALLGSTQGLNKEYADNSGTSYAQTVAGITKEVERQNQLLAESVTWWDTLKGAAALLGTTIAEKVGGALEWVNSLSKSLLGYMQSAGEWTGNLLADMAGYSQGGSVKGFATGGSVPGHGSGDTVPAMLTPGEFVVKKSVAQRARGFLHALNNGSVRGYAFGGFASPYGGTAMTSYNRYDSRGNQIIDPRGIYSSNPMVRLLTQYGGRLPWETHDSLGLSAPRLMPTNSVLGSSLFRGGIFGQMSAYRSGFSSFPWARFATGGEVKARHYASGGEVSSSTRQSAIPQSGPVGSNYSIGSMNLSFPNAKITPTVVRDTILPAIERETQGGRSRRSRTRR